MKEYLDLLHSENLRLSRLTEHFLTHTRLARGQQPFAFAPVPVASVVDPALAALQAKLEAPGCHFTLDVAKPLPEMLADRDSLSRRLLTSRGIVRAINRLRTIVRARRIRGGRISHSQLHRIRRRRHSLIIVPTPISRTTDRVPIVRLPRSRISRRQTTVPT